MKKLLICLMILSFSVPCLAGSMSSKKDINPVTAYEAPTFREVLESEQPAREVKIITKVVEKEKPMPSNGFYTGFSENYPVLGYDFGDLTAEIGYTSIASNQSGIIKGDWTFYRSEDKYTELKLAGAIYPGTAPLYGILIGAEQYLTPSISISGYIAPIKTGDGVDIISSSAIGTKLYF